MTREELLALPRADQSKSLMEWDKVLLVPLAETYEDTRWRLFAVIGMTTRHGVCEATHRITEGDLIHWDSSNIMPSIDMLADFGDSIGIFNHAYHLQVYGGGGTIFMKFVTPSTFHKL